MKKIVVFLTLALLMGGCAAQTGNVSENSDKNTRRDAAIKEKTSFAIGVETDQISISDVQRRGINVHYKATVEGRPGYYKCYYQSMGMTSDSLCTAISDEEGKKPQEAKQSTKCNDLLRASGKCQ